MPGDVGPDQIVLGGRPFAGSLLDHPGLFAGLEGATVLEADTEVMEEASWLKLLIERSKPARSLMP